MLFRIENNQEQGGDGKIREYELSFRELPRMKVKDMEKYIAEEIRKEINGSNNRNLLSYSKSLGVCLMKYNKFSINELHINKDNDNYIDNCITYYICKKHNIKEDTAYLDFDTGLIGLPKKDNEIVIIKNIEIDVSNNESVDRYLRKVIGVGIKKVASPEKDCEVLLMQSPDDLVISDYLHSIYLLYGLVLKYGMKTKIYNYLYDKIYWLKEDYFTDCPEERGAILYVLNYLYEQYKYERKVIKKILSFSEKELSIHFYSNVPVIQILKIQCKEFNDVYDELYDNSDVMCQTILNCYYEYYNE